MSDIEQELEQAVRETDAEILNEAFQDEPQQESEVQVEERAENRDPETGRFTAKEKTEEPEPKADVPEAKDDDHGQVPSWRLREINEEKRAAQARAEAAERASLELKSRLDMLERQFQQRQAPVEQKQEEIDPLIDPNGFRKSVHESLSQQLREFQLNTNLQLASVKHGETFEKAYNALIAEGQSGNRQLVHQLTNQSNPGEAIVKWYRNQQVLKEVGDDPAAYKNKLLEDALNDQAFIAKVIEKVRGGSPAQAQRPNNVTQLPPSLSRATGSRSGSSIEDDTDNSDASVFQYAMR